MIVEAMQVSLSNLKGERALTMLIPSAWKLAIYHDRAAAEVGMLTV